MDVVIGLVNRSFMYPPFLQTGSVRGTPAAYLAWCWVDMPQRSIEWGLALRRLCFRRENSVLNKGREPKCFHHGAALFGGGGDIDFKVFIRKQDSEKHFEPLRFLAREIQTGETCFKKERFEVCLSPV